MRPVARTLVPTALLLAAFAPTVRGQVVRGVVVDRDSGTHPEGAVVWLVDEGGTELPKRLIGADGTFILRAPAPGRYRLKVERIGYATTTGPAFDLADSVTVEQTLEIAPQPVSLVGLKVEAKQRCTVRPEAGAAAARLWDEARKALTVTALAADRELFTYRLVKWRRRLDLETLRVESDQREIVQGTSDNPIRSRPAAELQAEGYIVARPDGSFDYFAPDAQVLLSDAFLDDHCFTVREGKGDEKGLIGLAFQPVPGRDLPDVRGVLWLERDDARLRYLELGYTHYPYDVYDRRLGARVEFEPLPSGMWIVRRWWIRMPLLAQQRLRVGSGDVAPVHVGGILEAGAEVEGLPGRRTETGTRTRATLVGVVMDSTALAADGVARGALPLANASVYLSGTAFSATSDADGNFQIDDVPAGSYRVAFDHPRLAALGVHPTPVDVTLERGAVTRTSLAVPSPGSLLGSLCPDADPDALLLVGRVRPPAPDASTAGTSVLVSWRRFAVHTGALTAVEQRDGSVEAVPDGASAFHVCLPRPPDFPFRVYLQAHRGDAAGDAVFVDFDADQPLLERDVTAPGG